MIFGTMYHYIKTIPQENWLQSALQAEIVKSRLYSIMVHFVLLWLQSPEFFYSSIKTDLKLGNVFDVLDFVDELENLME